MSARLRALVPLWALAVFAFAFLARVAFWLLADQPLLYTHQYHYFTNGLRLAEHPSVFQHVLRSDEWRTWDGHWTIAPLYHLFLGAVFRLLGPSLEPLRVLQCALDATTAVGVGVLARRVAGPRGLWAGVAYALYWPALEMPTWTLTENLHTPLLVSAVALLATDPAPGRARAFAGGLLLGLSALARSVSAGFLGLAALWRLLARSPDSGAHVSFARRLGPALLLGLGGAFVILPWTARNVVFLHEHVLIESAAFENIWWANHFTDQQHFLRQQGVVHEQPTSAAKRQAALHFALRGLRRHPSLFVEKVRTNFWHFLRPEGLQNLLRVERSLEPWRHLGTLVLDDVPLLAAVPLFLVFLMAGRPSSARALMGMWAAYYLLMVVVIFHNEIRYRSALMPFALAGAAGGCAVLADPSRRRSWRAVSALAVGILLVCGMLQPHALPAWRALRARLAMGPALAALETGSAARARALASVASERDPGSPRPWLLLAQALARRGETAAAIEAYRAAAQRAHGVNWRPALGLARLLPLTGASEEAVKHLGQIDRYSWDADPWLMLEVAWDELPAPVTDEIHLALNDYGAVRGFLHPRGIDPAAWAHRQEWNRYDEAPGPKPPPGAHRWSRHRAWLRLVPTANADAYEVTLAMGAPFPATLVAPRVRVRAQGADWQSFELSPAIVPHTFRAPSPGSGRPLLLEIEAPTWSRVGEPADQGIRVDSLSVVPAR